MDVTPSFRDEKEKYFVHKKLRQLCKKIKKILIFIKNGVIDIFL